MIDPLFNPVQVHLVDMNVWFNRRIIFLMCGPFYWDLERKITRRIDTEVCFYLSRLVVILNRLTLLLYKILLLVTYSLQFTL